MTHLERGKIRFKTKFTIDKTRPKSNAHQKLATEKPFTNMAVNIINMALIAKVNKPKVMILIGKVKISKTGLIKVLIIPKTRATIKAVTKLSILTPRKR